MKILLKEADRGGFIFQLVDIKSGKTIYNTSESISKAFGLNVGKNIFKKI